MARRPPKQFHTKSQEEVYRAVKSHLDDLVEEHFDDAEHCDFYLKYGSTVLEISIEPYEDDDAVVEILAFCVQDVEASPPPPSRGASGPAARADRRGPPPRSGPQRRTPSTRRRRPRSRSRRRRSTRRKS